MMNEGLLITKVISKDLRFPTSIHHDGSDAMHKNPDYSCAYVILETNSRHIGYGLTFTLGRGTEIVVVAIKALEHILTGKSLKSITTDFASFYRELTSEGQLRWVGPEKGVVHLAASAVLNAVWDLWARVENKPVWRLLCHLSPAQLVSCIDFRYISDVITKEEAIEILENEERNKKSRIETLLSKGYPAYTTQVGWIGYSDDKIKKLTKEYLGKNFTAFKIKVGSDINQDKARCSLLRNIIGWENHLMLDANQVWDVPEAIKWIKELENCKPLWVEEPTSPDDVLGHLEISKSVTVPIATGEMCANRVMFKQFLQSGAMKYCQVDACRVGGINELLSIYLMAKKLKVKVCPHAGGIGLCEMIQHLQYWDYVSLSGSSEGKYIEYVDQQHEHFVTPVNVKDAHYYPSEAPGYHCQLKEEALEKYEYPNGSIWKDILKAK